MKPVDISMVTYQRADMTARAIKFLRDRTPTFHRLFVIDNHSTDETDKVLKEAQDDGAVFHWVKMGRNVGIHMAHNLGLAFAESKYYISTDNDIYVPSKKNNGEDFEDGWLQHMIMLMENNPEYGAIAAQPHVFLGAKLGEAENGIHGNNMCGAVMRIMRTGATKASGGWERKYDADRNHEEKTICSRLQANGFKTGYAEHVTCYHDFGEDNNWGYKDIHPHEHGHRIPGDEIWPPPSHLQQINNLNQETWSEKK